ncbi:hypothetical protein D9V86_01495 [Bacteroidetes/Chlorobi group bacterium ChocPot_Mid]|jgi:hypothetical protein|nr:MAG: hypothetical protein D9V86_01495 [Bacteroidetes/Chlorobi group bacterium ChocPot_Mid]
MKLMFLIDAKKEKLCSAHGMNPDDVEVVKIDDKWLAKRKIILGKMKEKKYENVYFGCIKLDYQRFQFFMKLYFLLSGYIGGAIIDEEGRANKFSFVKFIFKEIPMIIIEAVASVIVIIYSYIKFPIMKWYLTKK